MVDTWISQMKFKQTSISTLTEVCQNPIYSNFLDVPNFLYKSTSGKCWLSVSLKFNSWTFLPSGGDVQNSSCDVVSVYKQNELIRNKMLHFHVTEIQFWCEITWFSSFRSYYKQFTWTDLFFYYKNKKKIIKPGHVIWITYYPTAYLLLTLFSFYTHFKRELVELKVLIK